MESKSNIYKYALCIRAVKEAKPPENKKCEPDAKFKSADWQIRFDTLYWQGFLKKAKKSWLSKLENSLMIILILINGTSDEIQSQ